MRIPNYVLFSFVYLVGTSQHHQSHASSRADSQQPSQVSAAEIMSAAGLAAMAAAELGKLAIVFHVTEAPLCSYNYKKN